MIVSMIRSFFRPMQWGVWYLVHFTMHCHTLTNHYSDEMSSTVQLRCQKADRHQKHQIQSMKRGLIWHGLDIAGYGSRSHWTPVVLVCLLDRHTGNWRRSHCTPEFFTSGVTCTTVCGENLILQVQYIIQLYCMKYTHTYFWR